MQMPWVILIPKIHLIINIKNKNLYRLPYNSAAGKIILRL